MITQVTYPVRFFNRVLIDNDNLIIASDYTRLKNRISCYVKIESNDPDFQYQYGQVQHFCYFRLVEEEYYLAGVQFFLQDKVKQYNFPLVYLQKSPLLYIPIHCILAKVNLFPLYDDAHDVVGYWVTPSCR